MAVLPEQYFREIPVLTCSIRTCTAKSESVEHSGPGYGVTAAIRWDADLVPCRYSLQHSLRFAQGCAETPWTLMQLLTDRELRRHGREMNSCPCEHEQMPNCIVKSHPMHLQDYRADEVKANARNKQRERR